MDWTHLLLAVLTVSSLLLLAVSIVQTRAQFHLLVEHLSQNQRYLADQSRHIAQMVTQVAEIAERNEQLTRAVLLQVTGREEH